MGILQGILSHVAVGPEHPNGVVAYLIWFRCSRTNLQSGPQNCSPHHAPVPPGPQTPKFGEGGQDEA